MIKRILLLLILMAPLAMPMPVAGKADSAPEGFIVEEFLTGLKLCVTIAFAPDGRLFYLEKNSGKVRIVNGGKLDPKPWAVIPVDPVGERGLLGIAFDPDFKTNGYIYLYHSIKRSQNNQVIRLRDVKGRGTDVKIVLEIEDHLHASNHNGGNIAFGPNGNLYISVGDGGGWPGRSHEDTTLLGKILRIDVRGDLPVKFDKPSDIFYAKGLRNSFDMAWNPANNVLYATENGPTGRDEINKITEGGNYGWPMEKGFSDKHRSLNPIWDFGHKSAAPTGIAFYPKSGNFPKEYAGNMFVTDYNFGRLYRIRLTGEGLGRIEKDDFKVWFPARFADTVFADVTVGPDGALYLAGFSKIVRIRWGGKKSAR